MLATSRDCTRPSPTTLVSAAACPSPSARRSRTAGEALVVCVLCQTKALFYVFSLPFLSGNRPLEAQQQQERTSICHCLDPICSQVIVLHYLKCKCRHSYSRRLVDFILAIGDPAGPSIKSLIVHHAEARILSTNVTSQTCSRACSYCQSSQPEWSAFREPSFGHGTLDISPNSATWTWHRNQVGRPILQLLEKR